MPSHLDDQYLTLGEVLDLPALKLAQPRVLTSMDRIGTTPVSWVHVCEQPDMTDFVDADHLVLTSGIALGEDAARWEHMVDVLGAKRASGIIVELRVAIDTVPEPLIARAEALSLTFIVLDRPARFVDVTQSVHREIAQRQVLELERTAAAHEAFTQLTVESAGSQEIVDAVFRLTGAPVVLEDLERRVLASRSEQPPQVFLAMWERSAGSQELPIGSVVVPVRADGVTWGRLIVGASAAPAAFVSMVAERAVAAMAFSYSQATGRRLMGQDVQQRMMAEVFADDAPEDVRASLEAYGLPVNGASLVPGIFHVPAGKNALSMTIGWENALAASDVAGIMAERRPGTRHFLISMPSGRSLPDALRAVASALRSQGVADSVAFGTSASHVRDLAAGFESAEHAFAEAPFQPDLLYLTPQDLGVRGLLSLLETDARVRVFAQRRLGPLLALSEGERDRLLLTLRHYLESGRNVAAASRALHISRPALYARVRRIEKVLDADLDLAEVSLALHVAVLAREVHGRTVAGASAL